jgi:hypothetical protein
MDIGDKIPPPLPLPSGPASGSESIPARREALLGRRQKGVPPFAGFGKEGLGEISSRICLLNYGLLSTLVHKFANVFFLYPLRGLYATTLITEKDVIPAKAGIQENTGFPRIKYGAGLVKPGMTNHTGPIYHHV